MGLVGELDGEEFIVSFHLFVLGYDDRKMGLEGQKGFLSGQGELLTGLLLGPNTKLNYH